MTTILYMKIISASRNEYYLINGRENISHCGFQLEIAHLTMGNQDLILHLNLWIQPS